MKKINFYKYTNFLIILYISFLNVILNHKHNKDFLHTNKE